MVTIQYVHRLTGEVIAETSVTGQRGTSRFLSAFLADDTIAEALRRRDAQWVSDTILRIEAR